MTRGFTLPLLLTAASLLHLSSTTPGEADNPYRDTLGLSGFENRNIGDEERWPIQKNESENEDELFKDVDPKKLAAVLLRALNHSHSGRMSAGEENDGMEDEIQSETRVVKKEEAYRDVRPMEGADRDRDGRQELEMLMAAQGRDQEKEEEERKRAQEEEEKMTEKVTSHTMSQMAQTEKEQPSTGSDDKENNIQGVPPTQGSSNPSLVSTEDDDEEEEQLSPEELKSLETMMKEFPRLSTATKREGDSEPNERDSRGFSSYNDIIPINKGTSLAMSKKKLKWQEETQKAMIFPKFRDGNFMNDFVDNSDGSNAAQDQEVMEDDEPEVEEEDEETLSPEEEEARAKAEQEEIRRQAAEAQRAKMEEEKLADIASDMLLHYMVKQNNGNRKYSSSLPNAAEDKRSDEEQEVTEEEDIDPQTIDKLIEISSKLHLPADDVVDIISDVEKKKKKDVSPDMMSRWQQPLSSSTSPFSSSSKMSTNQNNFPVSKQPSQTVSFLKTWFQDKTPTPSDDLWSKPAKPHLVNSNFWPRLQEPSSSNRNVWLKPPKSAWTEYTMSPYNYPASYRRKPYPDYYPVYFPAPPKPKSRYFLSKPVLSMDTLMGNSVDNAYPFFPKRRYHSWVQPRLRKPSIGFQQKLYYDLYPLPLHPRTFKSIHIPKLHPPPRIPPQQKPFFYTARAPAVMRNKDYYTAENQPSSSTNEDLEKYIQQILMKRSQRVD
ncbi:uncharacterized protein vgf [Pholidichthys leucotaenia]